MSLGVSNFHKFFVQSRATPSCSSATARGFHRDRLLGVTEPDHGSDSLGFNQPHWNDASVRGNTVATRDGDDYVIAARSRRGCRNGTIATWPTLF